MQKLTQDEITTSVSELNRDADQPWIVSSGKLHKEFIFRNFIEAFGFMARAAILAEKMDHHPEWSNIYRKVIVDLTTHEASGITQLDFELAAGMQELV